MNEQKIKCLSEIEAKKRILMKRTRKSFKNILTKKNQNLESSNVKQTDILYNSFLSEIKKLKLFPSKEKSKFIRLSSVFGFKSNFWKSNLGKKVL
jgi:hypothetical protein